MEKKKQIVCSVLLNAAGILIYAAGINSFASPNEIAPGGASGIAILVNHMTGCPIGLFVFLFNIPFLEVFSCIVCLQHAVVHCRIVSSHGYHAGVPFPGL